MKKIITTLILSFFFFVHHSLSILAPTNSQQVVQNAARLKSVDEKSYKPNWLESSQKKNWAKTVKQQDTSTSWIGKQLLGILSLVLGILLLIAALALQENLTLLLAIGLSILGINLIFNARKQAQQAQQAIEAKAQAQAQAQTRYLNSFLNKEKSAVIATLGSFYTSVSDGKGGEILRYDTKKNKSDKATYDLSTNTITTTEISTIIQYMEFYINPSGIVYHVREGQRVE